MSHLPHSSRQSYPILALFHGAAAFFSWNIIKSENLHLKNKKKTESSQANIMKLSLVFRKTKIQLGLQLGTTCSAVSMDGDVAAEDSADPIMQRTCPLCLCELGVDHVSRLNQCSAGLDHLENREFMKLACMSAP